MHDTDDSISVVTAKDARLSLASSPGGLSRECARRAAACDGRRRITAAQRGLRRGAARPARRAQDHQRRPHPALPAGAARSAAGAAAAAGAQFPRAGGAAQAAAGPHRHGCGSVQARDDRGAPGGARLPTRALVQRGDARCDAAQGCAADVILCTIDRGGHTWPGGTEAFFLGKTSSDLDATSAILDFFLDHPYSPMSPAMGLSASIK